MPGTPLEVEYPTFELLTDGSIPTAAGRVIWFIFFLIWLWLTGTHWSWTWDISTLMFPLPTLSGALHPTWLVVKSYNFSLISIFLFVGNTSPYWNKVSSYFRFMQTLIYGCRSARWSMISDPPKKNLCGAPQSFCTLGNCLCRLCHGRPRVVIWGFWELFNWLASLTNSDWEIS